MSDFSYKLNAMEHASQNEHPYKMGYADKRKAVLGHVAELEAKLTNLDWWCDSCKQRYSGPPDHNCSRASCPTCGTWMLATQEHDNDKLRAKCARYEQAERELPGGPPRIAGCMNLYVPRFAYDKLRDYAVALKVENESLRENAPLGSMHIRATKAEAALATARQEERSRCAKIANGWASQCAEAIRALTDEVAK